MSRFLVVGESLVDIVEEGNGDRTEVPGGSPANVALGLARLGESVDLLTWLGTDQRGTAVLDHLTAPGVNVLRESLGATRTPTALARLDETGGATYEFDLEWQLVPIVVPRDIDVVHTGSIAAVADPQPADALLRMVHDACGSATITYDPNLRPSIMGEPGSVRERVEGLVAAADVVKVSEEDLGWLHPDADPLDIAGTWVDDLECALVVVTHGGRGSTALLPHGHRVEVRAPVVTVVDTVGAGDSYMSGMLSALHRHGLVGARRRHDLYAMAASEVTAILDFSTSLAAITVSRAGANPPHLAEVSAAG